MASTLVEKVTANIKINTSEDCNRNILPMTKRLPDTAIHTYSCQSQKYSTKSPAGMHIVS
jgi:hypothetical protein